MSKQSGQQWQSILPRLLQGFLEAFFWANYTEPDFFWLDSGQGEYCSSDEIQQNSLGRFAFFGFRAAQQLQYFADGQLEIDRQRSYCQPLEALEAVAALARRQGKPFPKVYTADGLILPFQAGIVGAVAYEFGYLLQPSWASSPQFRNSEQLLLQFNAYEAILAVDLQYASYMVSGNPETDIFALLHRRAEQARTSATEPAADTAKKCGEFQWQLHCQYQYSEYRKKFQQIQKYLKQGEIYQLSFTQQLQLSWVDGKEITNEQFAQLYLALRRQHPVPFAAYWAGCSGRNSEQAILSFSPERFYQFDATLAELRTRPMKGTRSRQSEPREDALAFQELCQSSKERAELLMICDLLRNDLYRICQVDSVCPAARASFFDRAAPWPFQIEKYPSVWQQTVAISGRLQAHIKDLILRKEGDKVYVHQIGKLWQALFPCGSITGAPKIRAMQLIAELEPLDRSWYTGNLGYIDCSGNMEFNVLIRSFFRKPSTKNQLLYHVGSAVLWDSQASSEWQELAAKCQFFLDVLQLQFPKA